MESEVKLCSPQNKSGALQLYSAAAFPWHTEVDGDLFWKIAP